MSNVTSHMYLFMDSNKSNLKKFVKFKWKLSMLEVEFSIVITQRLSKIYSFIEVSCI